LIHRSAGRTSLICACIGFTIWVACFERNASGERLGSTLLLVSMLVYTAAAFAQLLEKHGRAADVVFQEGYEMGFKQGHDEGRRVGKPVLVELPQRLGASSN
jgi:hypothetical protein